jgi:hypothetical protein
LKRGSHLRKPDKSDYRFNELYLDKILEFIILDEYTNIVSSFKMQVSRMANWFEPAAVTCPWCPAGLRFNRKK